MQAYRKERGRYGSSVFDIRGRLYNASRAVALTSCYARAAEHIEPTEFTWLQPKAEAQFTAAARTFWAQGSSKTPPSDEGTRAELLFIVVQRTAELRRFPGFAGVGVQAVETGMPPEFAAGHDPGVFELDGQEHRLNGRVDGRLLYVNPLGKELYVTDSPRLLEEHPASLCREVQLTHE